MKNYITINYKQQEVWCYGGPLQDEDNIVMAYEDDADTIENFNYETNKPFSNWREAVKYLIDLNRFGTIHEMERG